MPRITGRLSAAVDRTRVGKAPRCLPRITSAALWKVPALSWVQMVAYAEYCELSGPRTQTANASVCSDISSGNCGFKVFASEDPAEPAKMFECSDRQ